MFNQKKIKLKGNFYFYNGDIIKIEGKYPLSLKLEITANADNKWAWRKYNQLSVPTNAAEDLWKKLDDQIKPLDDKASITILTDALDLPEVNMEEKDTKLTILTNLKAAYSDDRATEAQAKAWINYNDDVTAAIESLTPSVVDTELVNKIIGANNATEIGAVGLIGLIDEVKERLIALKILRNQVIQGKAIINLETASRTNIEKIRDNLTFFRNQNRTRDDGTDGGNKGWAWRKYNQLSNPADDAEAGWKRLDDRIKDINMSVTTYRADFENAVTADCTTRDEADAWRANRKASNGTNAGNAYNNGYTHNEPNIVEFDAEINDPTNSDPIAPKIPNPLQGQYNPTATDNNLGINCFPYQVTKTNADIINGRETTFDQLQGYLDGGTTYQNDATELMAQKAIALRWKDSTDPETLLVEWPPTDEVGALTTASINTIIGATNAEEVEIAHINAINISDTALAKVSDSSLVNLIKKITKALSNKVEKIDISDVSADDQVKLERLKTLRIIVLKGESMLKNTKTSLNQLIAVRTALNDPFRNEDLIVSDTNDKIIRLKKLDKSLLEKFELKKTLNYPTELECVSYYIKRSNDGKISFQTNDNRYLAIKDKEFLLLSGEELSPEEKWLTVIRDKKKRNHKKILKNYIDKKDKVKPEFGWEIEKYEIGSERNIKLKHRINEIQTKPEARLWLANLVSLLCDGKKVRFTLTSAKKVEVFIENDKKDENFPHIMISEDTKKQYFRGNKKIVQGIIFKEDEKYELLKLEEEYENEEELHKDTRLIMWKALSKSKISKKVNVGVGNIIDKVLKEKSKVLSSNVKRSDKKRLKYNGFLVLANLLDNWDLYPLGSADALPNRNDIITAFSYSLIYEPQIIEKWRDEFKRIRDELEIKSSELSINELSNDNEKKEQIITKWFEAEKNNIDKNSAEKKLENKRKSLNWNLSKNNEDEESLKKLFKKDYSSISKFDQLKVAQKELENFRKADENSPNKQRAWQLHNNKAEKLYNEIKEKNSTFNRLQNISLYGTDNAELYMIYIKAIKEEIPNYIEKVKEEMGTRFITFNKKFKEENDESFGDYVVKKITDSEDFYSHPDWVWREIENAKEGIQRKTLDIAPTVPPGLERNKDTALAGHLCELWKECEDHLNKEERKKKIEEKLRELATFLEHHKDEIEEVFEDIIESLWYGKGEDDKKTRYDWIKEKLNEKLTVEIEETLKLYKYNKEKILYKNNDFSSEESKDNWQIPRELPIKLFNVKKYSDKKQKENVNSFKEDFKNGGKNDKGKNIEKTRVIYVEAEKDIKKNNEKNPKYATLSYVCGDEPLQEQKYMSTKAKKSLARAIGACKFLGIDYLWVDKLCVNQEDNDEKAQEIRKFFQYYDNAAVTLVSIGRKLKNEEDFLPSFPEILRKIVNSRWFKRSWTYQEGWLSKQTIFMFDDYLVDGQAIAQTWVLEQPLYTKYARYNSLEEEAKGLKKIATPVGWVHYKDGYDEDDRLKISLGQALKEVKSRERLHSVDGIYTLLGLLPYGEKVNTSKYYKGVGKYYDKLLSSALSDIIKTAMKNGYCGDFFGWHGSGNNWLPKIENKKNGSTSSKGGLTVICKCPNNSQKVHNCKYVKITNKGIEIKASRYIVAVNEDERSIGIESSKGFLIEGGLHKRRVSIDYNKVSITGSKETLDKIKGGNILLILDKNQWESESPFAILVSEKDETYQREGIVGFYGKAEFDKLKKKTSEDIIIQAELIEIDEIEMIEKDIEYEKDGGKLADGEYWDEIIKKKNIEEEVKKKLQGFRREKLERQEFIKDKKKSESEKENDFSGSKSTADDSEEVSIAKETESIKNLSSQGEKALKIDCDSYKQITKQLKTSDSDINFWKKDWDTFREKVEIEKLEELKKLNNNLMLRNIIELNKTHSEEDWQTDILKDFIEKHSGKDALQEALQEIITHYKK
ncbi:MAG: hypothetical protein mread185_000350 [Mycoplasmataceae bacterium]|nr:MAG: hypothetical protein mread185_000350 [Mycoplasmataceae bacterium]